MGYNDRVNLERLVSGPARTEATDDTLDGEYLKSHLEEKVCHPRRASLISVIAGLDIYMTRVYTAAQVFRLEL